MLKYSIITIWWLAQHEVNNIHNDCSALLVVCCGNQQHLCRTKLKGSKVTALSVVTWNGLVLQVTKTLVVMSLVVLYMSTNHVMTELN